MTSLLPPRWHPVLVVVLAAGAVICWIVARRLAIPVSRAQRTRFALALLALLLAYGWPLGDLAARVSLAALVLQRLLVLLAAAPLFLSSLPVDVTARLTRPTVLDRALQLVSKPGVAVPVVTVIGTISLLPSVVGWTTSTPAAGATMCLLNLVLGAVLWLPILSVVPGTRRLSYVGKGAYLFVSSLVVNVLSIVWIFARHPMYPCFHNQRLVLGISPLLDQQLAGFVAKLGAYAPMWSIAFVLLARAGSDDQGDEPLRWADVQRELERGERRGTLAEPTG